MKKRTLIALLIIVLCLTFAFAACDKTEKVEVELNKESLSIEVGKTALLSVKVTGTDEKAVFASDNESVAIVNEYGKVTAVAEGTATITASVGDVKATCIVTVTKLPETETVNGFKAFAKGGLLGGEGGTYNKVTVTAVGDNAVQFKGKGGLSWPDTANMPEPSAMGGYYNQELDLDGLTFTWKLDEDMKDFKGDHWYFVALGNKLQLFNSWDGADPTKTLFFMFKLEDGMIRLMPHYRDVVDLGEGWSYLGTSQGIKGKPTDQFTVQMAKTPAGYTVYLNGELQIFDNIKSPYITVCNDLFSNDKCYMMTAAHIGNPDGQYEGEYAFTLGLEKNPATIVGLENVAFTNATEELEVGDEMDLSTIIFTPENVTNKFVSYKSSDTNVVTVDANGHINAVGVGVATITASCQGKKTTCEITVNEANVVVNSLTLDRSKLEVKQFETVTLVATAELEKPSKKKIIWTIVDDKDNVEIAPKVDDDRTLEIKGLYLGTCTIKGVLGDKEVTCEVTVTTGTLNGFAQFEKGGLVNETAYDNHIKVEDLGTTDRVKFTGKGGSNWGDAESKHSTMGGYYNEKLTLDKLNILYSVDGWIDGATEHWYFIALTSGAKDELFGTGKDDAATLFFMFAYDNGNVVLRAHYVGGGNEFTQIGKSQGVVAAGGQYSIAFVKVEGGYSVYMKNAGDESYTLQKFGETEVLSDEIVGSVVDAEGKVYLQAGAYAKTFANDWAFTLGVGEPFVLPTKPDEGTSDAE